MSGTACSRRWPKRATPKPSCSPRDWSCRARAAACTISSASVLFSPSSTYAATWFAFGGRIVDKNDPGAKYMNSPETIIYSKRRVLYGLNLAKKSKRENIILVEGNIDVVMLHQAGFDNACASMGTALTTEQIRLLSRYTKELTSFSATTTTTPDASPRRRRWSCSTTPIFLCACSSFPTASWTGSRSSRTRTTLSRIRARRLRAAAQRQRNRHGLPHGAACGGL